jgi:hypothetical protein
MERPMTTGSHRRLLHPAFVCAMAGAAVLLSVSVVTVDGNAFNLPADGTGDNDWSGTQTVTVPVTLNAGENTIEFSNPDNYAADVSQIAL